jgi:CRP-like cAMP-binding protein
MLRQANVHPALGNLILAALSKEEYERLQPFLEFVRLARGRNLYIAGGMIRHVYFLVGGMASLLSVTEEGKAIEVGMIGSEGMVGIPVVLGSATSPYEVGVQLPGNALRIRADKLMTEFSRGGRLHDLLLRYAHTILTQISQSACCNRFHTVEERLCRWLLVSHDRTHSGTLHLTQEFLSQMIGVPRTSVTTVAGKLQRAGLIRYSRGKILIINKPGLETASCECYRIVQNDIREFIAA